MRLFFVTPTTWTQVPNPLPFPLRQGWIQALLAIKISALASPPIQNSHKRHRNPQFEVAKSNPNQNDRKFASLCLKIHKNSAFSHLKPQPNPGKSTRRPVRLDHARGLTSDDTPLQMEGCVRSKSRVSQFKGIHQESPLTIVEKCNDSSGLSRIKYNPALMTTISGGFAMKFDIHFAAELLFV